MANFPLDVILRTFNREHMVRECITSFLEADRSGIDLHLYVVDNNSKDRTLDIVRDIASEHPDLMTVLVEKKPNAITAMNTALKAGNAANVAFFDDDETLDPNWLQVIKTNMADPAVDFIGGKCIPKWTQEKPSWLPEGFGGVLGIIDNGRAKTQYGSDGFYAMMTQGNCALRRAIYDEAGLPPDTLSTAEDRWIFEWLMKNDKLGYYCPDLIINHIMQDQRLNKDYFRKWAKREGSDVFLCGRMSGQDNLLKKKWFWRLWAEDIAISIGNIIPGLVKEKRGFRAELDMRVKYYYTLAALKSG